MPSATANTKAFGTRVTKYPPTNIPSATAANTITKVVDGDAYGSAITDILFRNFSASTVVVGIIHCATGSQATPENERCQITIAANAGQGSTQMSLLSQLQPGLFDCDISGNRIMILEAGNSIYIKNAALLGAAVYVTVKEKDYTP